MMIINSYYNPQMGKKVVQLNLDNEELVKSNSNRMSKIFKILEKKIIMNNKFIFLNTIIKVSEARER